MNEETTKAIERMEVSELKLLKKESEIDIKRILNNFQKQTNVSVQDIRAITATSIVSNERDPIVRIELTLDL